MELRKRKNGWEIKKSGQIGNQENEWKLGKMNWNYEEGKMDGSYEKWMKMTEK